MLRPGRHSPAATATLHGSAFHSARTRPTHRGTGVTRCSASTVKRRSACASGLVQRGLAVRMDHGLAGRSPRGLEQRRPPRGLASPRNVLLAVGARCPAFALTEPMGAQAALALAGAAHMAKNALSPFCKKISGKSALRAPSAQVSWFHLITLAVPLALSAQNKSTTRPRQQLRTPTDAHSDAPG